MKANRTITREKAMTVLYQIFLYNKNNISYKIDDVINEILESMDIEDRKKIDINFLNDLVNGVINNMDNIDEYISKYLSETK